MLSWDHPDQEKLIVAISSGSFNRAQMNWGTTEQECFAFCRGILDNEFLLAGREFNLITDHKNLSYIVESESKKVRRWKLAMQEFQFFVIHTSGITIPEADWLSRL